SRTEGDLYVRFNLEEGPLVRVTGVGIDYTGEHRTQAADAARNLRLRPGQPLSPDAVKADALALVKWLTSNGFRTAKVAAPHDQEAGGKRVVCVIDEGRFTRVGEPLLHGKLRVLP